MRKMKSIAIVGEGLTESLYFDSLRIALKYRFKVRPSLPCHTDIESMANSAGKLVNEGYDYVYCLVDMDRIEANSKERENYKKVRSRCNKKIRWIHTFPCTEFWFLLHFLKSGQVKYYRNYDELSKELSRYMPGYEKTTKYFRKVNLYEFLTTKGSLDKAINNAKELEKIRQTDKGIDYSEIFKVVEKLRELGTV